MLIYKAIEMLFVILTGLSLAGLTVALLIRIAKVIHTEVSKLIGKVEAWKA